MRMDEKERNEAWTSVTGAVLSLALATALVGALEVSLSIDNASAVYLLAVAAIAIRWGTIPALGTAIGAFLVYNVLFVEPRFTVIVARPDELVTLLLLLFVGIVIGRLAGRQRDRERLAVRREREARALFVVTRELATAHRLPAAMHAVLERLVAETGMTRTWVGLGATQVQERIAADSAPDEPIPAIGTHAVLRRDHEEGAAVWSRIHSPLITHVPGGRRANGRALFRVELRSGEQTVGSLWCQRPISGGNPYLEETRLLAASADQMAQAVRRDRLAATAAEVEIARRTDELRNALLDSVSHDLRTPLASIRAAAGSIADPSIELDPDERRAAARSIDEEAERLNRLVGTLLDMSRIQAGALVADLDIIPLGELVFPVVERMRAQLRPHPLTVDITPDLPNVRVDATFLSQALLNVLENATRYAPAGTPIVIRAASANDRTVSLVVEDGGPGVDPATMPHLFERFYRGAVTDGGARRGFGLGLTVVRGLVEAMGGSVRAERSQIGGLAIVMDLAAATLDVESGT